MKKIFLFLLAIFMSATTVCLAINLKTKSANDMIASTNNLFLKKSGKGQATQNLFTLHKTRNSLKSAEAIKMKLDSVVAAESYKTSFTYNDDGCLSTQIYYEWNTDQSTWTKTDKEEYGYDDAGRITTETYYSWDEDSKSWNASDNTETIYNAQGLPSITLSQTSATKFEFQYTFDNSGNPTAATALGYISMDGETWTVTSKMELMFDSHGNQTSNAVYQANWLSEGENSWIGMYKETSIFNENNNKAESLFYFWNNELSDWKATEKDTISYDTNSNPILETLYKEKNNEWSKEYECEFIYDLNYSIQSLIVPANYTETGAKNMITGTKESEYDNELQSWKSFESTCYYSQQLLNGLTKASATDIEIYPNPTAESFTINGLEGKIRYSITDINGATVQNQMVNTNETVSVDALPKGLYIVKIATPNGIVSRKLIKK